MNIPEIPKEKGPLIQICNKSFHAVKGKLPERIRETNDYDRTLATIFGAPAGYIVATAGKYAVEFANKFGFNLDLDTIASHCLAATVATPFIAYGISPYKVNEMYEEDPVYTTGVVSVMSGASVKALEVLLF